MKTTIGAQGEITIRVIDALPADVTLNPVADRTDKGTIISRSERGHHHVLLGDAEVMENVTGVPQGMRILYAILKQPSALVQDAPVPHESQTLPAGIIEFRIAREYDPFSEISRRVTD